MKQNITHLAMRKPVQEAALLHMLNVQDDIAVPTAASGGHDVLVEGERREDDDDQEVDDGAYGAHALGDLLLVQLAHVDALDARLDEGGAQPPDHGVRRREGHAAQGQRRAEGCPIALERVGDDGCAGGRQRQETQRLGARERARHVYFFSVVNVVVVVGAAG